MRSKKNKVKRTTVVLLSVVTLLGCVASGTLAWLAAKTEVVTNTFTVGDINMDLYEHTRDTDGNLTATETKTLNDYKILPGTSEKKDPTVEITGKSEDCYVFLQVQEINNNTGNAAGTGVTTKYISYSIDDAVWQPLMDGTDQVIYNGVPVYYTTYAQQDTDKSHNVLNNKTVTYSEDLTKADIEKLYGADNALQDSEKPQLVFKAFAVQIEASDTALAAWDLIPDADKLPDSTI